MAATQTLAKQVDNQLISKLSKKQILSLPGFYGKGKQTVKKTPRRAQTKYLSNEIKQKRLESEGLYQGI